MEQHSIEFYAGLSEPVDMRTPEQVTALEAKLAAFWAKHPLATPDMSLEEFFKLYP